MYGIPRREAWTCAEGAASVPMITVVNASIVRRRGGDYDKWKPRRSRGARGYPAAGGEVKRRSAGLEPCAPPFASRPAVVAERRRGRRIDDGSRWTPSEVLSSRCRRRGGSLFAWRRRVVEWQCCHRFEARTSAEQKTKLRG